MTKWTRAALMAGLALAMIPALAQEPGAPVAFPPAPQQPADADPSTPGTQAAPTRPSEEGEKGEQAALDPKQVSSVMDASQDAFQACFEATREPQAEDVVEVHFTILPDGSVQDPRVRKAVPSDDALKTCVLAVVGGLRFPSFTAEKMEANFPLRPVRAAATNFNEDPALQKAFTPYAEQAKQCWRDAVEAGRRVEGQVVTSWTIQESGEVRDAMVERSALRDAEVEACMVKVISEMKLPARTDVRTVRFTWDFEVEDWKLTAFGSSKKPWSVTATFSTSSGMMLLHPTEFVRSYYSTAMVTLNASGSYRLADKVSAGLGLGGALELTTPNDPGGRRFWPSDPVLSVTHASLFKDEALTGVNVMGGASLSLGLSPTSLYQTKIAGLGLNLGAGRAFLDDRLRVNLMVMGSGFLHRYSSPVVRRYADDAVEMVIVRTGGAEDLGASLAAVAGNNPAVTANGMLSVGYQFTDKLSGNLGFGMGRVWTYAGTCDEFTPDTLDSNGNPVGKCGLSAMDMMNGNLSAAYQLTPRIGLSGGLGTGGRIFGYERRDPDDPDAGLDTEVKRLRFPFWDPNLQSSSLFLAASATF